MGVIIGSARIDEHGRISGGTAGDQTGKEVSTQGWYAHSKGWVVLRAKDKAVREKLARCMQAACDNRHIGYDQGQRSTLYTAAKEFGFDVSKVTKDVETDCSALVRVCCAYAGITVGGFTTGDEAAVLTDTGAFTKYTDATHCKKSTNLLRGDILVTASKGHTAIVLSDGSCASAETEPVGQTVVIINGTANLRRGNSTGYAMVGTAAPGKTFALVATAANGWNAVEAGDCVAWVSGRYSRVV